MNKVYAVISKNDDIIPYSFGLVGVYDSKENVLRAVKDIAQQYKTALSLADDDTDFVLIVIKDKINHQINADYHFEYDLAFTSHELLKLAESDELPKWNDYSNPDR